MRKWWLREEVGWMTAMPSDGVTRNVGAFGAYLLDELDLACNVYDS